MASKNRTANPLLLAFIIPLTLACLWTLTPTYVKHNVNKDADAYAEKQLENIVAINQIDETREAALRDSFTNVFSEEIVKVNFVALQEEAEKRAQDAFRSANAFDGYTGMLLLPRIVLRSRHTKHKKLKQVKL